MRRLWAAELVSQIGDWAARITLALLVYERSGSALAAAAVTAAALLPWLGVGQVLSTLADRFSHRRVMVVSNAHRAVVFLVLAATHLPVWAVLALALLAGLGDPPFEAARSAALPQLAGAAYDRALVVLEVTFQSATLLGFAVGGLLVAVFSPALALGVNAATFVVAGFLLLGLPRTTSGPDGGDHEDGEDDDGAAPAGPVGTAALLRHGGSALLSDRLVTTAAVVVTASAVGAIAAESLIAAYAAALGRSSATAGLLAAVPPAAAVVAALVIPRRPTDEATVTAVTVTAAALSLGAAAAFTASGALPDGAASTAVACLALALAGALLTLSVPAGAVIGRRLPRASRASAFSLLQGSLQVTQAVSALGAGLVAVHLGVPTALALACVPAVLVAGAVLLRGRGGTATPEPTPEPTPALPDERTPAVTAPPRG